MRTWLLIFLVLGMQTLWATTTDLFISEYIEGSSNNKALEIYNGTGQDVDLSQYQLRRISNGGTWDGAASLDLSGTLVNGDVYVVANNQAGSEISQEADLLTTFCSWNGDDAVGLFKSDGAGGWVLIDEVGEEGDDPGSGWDVAGVTNATKDHTLLRKSTITQGNTNWSSSAGTNSEDSEWEVQPQDYFDDLGRFEEAGADNPPSISDVTANPKVPLEDEDMVVTATVTDDNGLTVVQLRYQVNEGGWVTVSMTNTSGDQYQGTIPESAYSNGDRLEYYVYAEDNASPANSRSSAHSYVFTGYTTMQTVHAVDDNGVATYQDYYARLSGVSTVEDSTFSSYSLDVYFQDDNGGINVYKSGAGATAFYLSHSYTVVGQLKQYRGKLEIVPDDASADITDNGSTTAPDPLVKTIAELLADPESYEGRLVKILQCTKTDGEWPAEGSDASLTITDDEGAHTLTLRIDKDTDIDGSEEGTYPVDIVGIFSQYDTSEPYDDGYQILPRSTADLTWSPNSIERCGVEISSFVLYPNYPNPFNPATTIKVWVPDHAQRFTLTIYDVNGQRIKQLHQGNLSVGWHSFTWRGDNNLKQPAASGIYFAVLKADHTFITRKLILAR